MSNPFVRVFFLHFGSPVVRIRQRCGSTQNPFGFTLFEHEVWLFVTVNLNYFACVYILSKYMQYRWFEFSTLWKKSLGLHYCKWDKNRMAVTQKKRVLHIYGNKAISACTLELFLFYTYLLMAFTENWANKVYSTHFLVAIIVIVPGQL